jgi:type IV pilus assembly protein PilP
LDALPLAGMRLVGSVQRGDQSLALLRVQGLVYSVRVGDKIGQDQGRVSAITVSGLVLRERALNAAGQPVERVVSLALVQEP